VCGHRIGWHGKPVVSLVTELGHGHAPAFPMTLEHRSLGLRNCLRMNINASWSWASVGTGDAPVPYCLIGEVESTNG
jgi:hypothetical protein